MQNYSADYADRLAGMQVKMQNMEAVFRNKGETG
jgi:hypothetical protein